MPLFFQAKPMSQITHSARAVAARPSLRPFLLRLHFYIGLFVGPFIFVAALTGLLYVLTPQIESWLYRGALYTDSTGPARSLTDQARAARDVLGTDLAVSAVRPAIAPGTTTRVMFSDPLLGESENRTLFVDPVTLEVRGDLTTYGTTGILPFRITLITCIATCCWAVSGAITANWPQAGCGSPCWEGLRCGPPGRAAAAA